MKCPTCRRRIVEGEESCPRCATDLTLLLQLDQHHERLLKQGNTALITEDYDQAQTYFLKALELKKESSKAKKALILLDLFQGDYTRATTQYLKLKQ